MNPFLLRNSKARLEFWLIKSLSFASSPRVPSERRTFARFSILSPSLLMVALISGIRLPPLSNPLAIIWPSFFAVASSTGNSFTITGFFIFLMSSAFKPNSAAWSINHCLYLAACSGWEAYISFKASTRLLPWMVSCLSFTLGAEPMKALLLPVICSGSILPAIFSASTLDAWLLLSLGCQSGPKWRRFSCPLLWLAWTVSSSTSLTWPLTFSVGEKATVTSLPRTPPTSSGFWRW